MTAYFSWDQRWGPGHVKNYPMAAARLINAGQDMREALRIILSTTTDRAAREEAARVLAVADEAARVKYSSGDAMKLPPEPPSVCTHCDDLGWEWEHGKGGESWKVPCRRWCGAAKGFVQGRHTE